MNSGGSVGSPLFLIATLLAPGALFLAPGVAQAQQLSTRIPIDTGRSEAGLARGRRIPPDAIRLDGRLDDPVWQSAPVISDFLQRDPNEGQAGSERTEARIAY